MWKKASLRSATPPGLLGMHDDILPHLCKNCLKLIREYEQMSLEMADYRNYPSFSFRCRQTNAIDVFKSKAERIQWFNADSDEEGFQQVIEFTEKAHPAHHEVIASREKFDVLQHTINQDLGCRQSNVCQTRTEDVDEWVKSLSNNQLKQRRIILVKGRCTVLLNPTDEKIILK